MHDLRTENLSDEEEDLAFLLFFSGTTFSNIDSAMDPDSNTIQHLYPIWKSNSSPHPPGHAMMQLQYLIWIGSRCCIAPGVGSPLHFLRMHVQQPKPLLFSSCVHSAEKAKLMQARTPKPRYQAQETSQFLGANPPLSNHSGFPQTRKYIYRFRTFHLSKGEQKETIVKKKSRN